MEAMEAGMRQERMKPDRKEILNFKDKEGQENFKIFTSETNEFTDCFKSKEPLKCQVENWRQILSTYCKKSFKKIRIRNTHKKPVKKSIAVLIDKRNKITDEGSESQKEDIERNIAELEALEIRNEIMKNFKLYSENPENISMQKMWKVFKRLSPKSAPTLPTAKRNHKGKIVSGPKEIKILLGKEYKNRLRSRPIRPDLMSLKVRRKIFQQKLKLAGSRRSKKWTMENLDRALADLKIDKSRDADGLINEIFKKDVIGGNLKESMLIMFNRLREEKLIPKFLNSPNITTVPKQGSLLNPENKRGIFRVSVIRYILMRIIYNEKYPIIDSNMSDCQMGGRKGKGC